MKYQIQSTALILIFLFGFSCSPKMGLDPNADSANGDENSTIVEYFNTHGFENIEYAVLSTIENENGIDYLYLQQLHNGIPLLDVVGTALVQSGELTEFNGNFVEDLPKAANTKNAMDPNKVMSAFLSARELPIPTMVNNKASNERHFFESIAPYHSPPSARLVYYNADQDNWTLAYELEVDDSSSGKAYRAILDAQSGKELKVEDRVVHCAVPHFSQSSDNDSSREQHMHGYTENISSSSSYLVYPFPLVSPQEGIQQNTSAPYNDLASPFGWHDTNGSEGAEYRITRGNNVHAFQDTLGNSRSAGDEPNGGSSLSFNFPHNPNLEPYDNIDSDVVQLFYANNWMHDFAYILGFDEASGNFQDNNYGKGGSDDDPINANALAFREDENGDEQFNNANFFSPRDGNNGRMNMFRWNVDSGAEAVEVISPDDFKGRLSTGSASFGPPVTEQTNIQGNIAIFQDGQGDGTDGCSQAINSNEINGNVALINRGTCEFGLKALNAQRSGAIAAIICNVAGVNGGDGEDVIAMGGGDFGDQVNIPTVMIKKSDCDLVRTYIQSGSDVVVRLELEPQSSGPSLLSSSFDNGVVAHEFAHGISIRLSGGRNTTSCLTNDEQAGEGWSDFFGLISTHKESDLATDSRGMATYLEKQEVGSKGIRRFPYTTDMSVNPLTFDDIRFIYFNANEPPPHPVGEVFATALWEMYWNLIDAYGFDIDWTNENSGNHRAARLVIEGLKLQPCSPGFMDSRDAILQADRLLYNGDNQCMIWKAFAKRGMGFSAQQNNTDDQDDGVEAFDVSPECSDVLAYEKIMTEYIEPGDAIHVELKVTNYKTDYDQVEIIDLLPENASLVEILTDGVSSRQAGDTLFFTINELMENEIKSIEYTLMADDPNGSELFVYDNFKNSPNLLASFPIEGIREWTRNTSSGYWNIAGSMDKLDQGLTNTTPFTVRGDNPYLRLKHEFRNDIFFSGGVVEISTDGGNSWNYIDESKFSVGNYSDAMSFFAVAVPDLKGFTGEQDIEESWIDLSDYIGEQVFIRFRYANDANTLNALTITNSGWRLHYMELIDAKIIDGFNSRLITSRGDTLVAHAQTLISSGEASPNNEVLASESNFYTFPNPTAHEVTVEISFEEVQKSVLIEIFNLQGQLLDSKSYTSRDQIQDTYDLSNYPDGVYTIKASADHLTVQRKVVKQ